MVSGGTRLLGQVCCFDRKNAAKIFRNHSRSKIRINLEAGTKELIWLDHSRFLLGVRLALIKRLNKKTRQEFFGANPDKVTDNLSGRLVAEAVIHFTDLRF